MSETAQAKESVKATRHRLRLRRFSMLQLLIALALLFFFAPFVEAIKGGALIVSVLLSLVLLSGVLAVASRRRTLTVALLLAIPAVAGRWLNHFQPHLPGAFAFNTTTGTKETMEGFNAFYFSFITLSTVGYGDITPVSKVARMLAATEAMTGLLYVAVLIARLVALYSTPNLHDSYASCSDQHRQSHEMFDASDPAGLARAVGLKSNIRGSAARLN